MATAKIKTIVIGSLNTDLIIRGLNHFPKPGEHVYGKQFKIGPGGKSRNIADMIAHLVEPSSVAMVSKTVKDPYNLWQQPVDALNRTGVNTEYVKILDEGKSSKMPSMVAIAVKKNGANQLYAVPGISEDFNPGDIDDAKMVFNKAAENRGYLVMTLECPIKTAEYAARKAKDLGIKVLLDPGGITPGTNIDKLLRSELFFLKPNEHEAKYITGIDVTDAKSAAEAAKILLTFNIENVMITVGNKGAYLFTEIAQKYIPVPRVKRSLDQDATGCGDQTMAVFCVGLQDGLSIEKAAEMAVCAGTLQFNKIGIQPVTRDELRQFSKS